VRTTPARRSVASRARLVRTTAGLLLALALAAPIAGCGRTGTPSAAGSSAGSGPGGAKLQVVAAENTWGSIATQLAGKRASVRSIIVNPNTDPHSYEPNAADARTIAGAQLVIVNGLDYDDWAPRLLAASPLSGRAVLTVGSLLGLRAGDNPHQWYSPASVERVAHAIAQAYARLDPADAAYFAGQERAFLTAGLARYDQLRSEIRARYAGVPVGYSESIFQPLGQDLGLRLLTPAGFARAIAEGTDVTAQDKRTVDAQVSGRAIKVWVLNSQNVTPDVQRVTELARAKGIPVATVTETLAPPSASFQQWQADQLRALLRALHTATGR
jgi:zinc/manganese transport system substrate-binding protein